MIVKKFPFLIISFLILLMLPQSLHAMVIELSGEYSYGRQVYGSERQNDVTTTTSGGAVAFYLFQLIALEFNYNKSKQVREDHPNLAVTGSSYVLTNLQTTVTSEAWGAGVRFSLAPTKAIFRPDISLGYANQAIVNSSLYIFTSSTDGSTLNQPVASTKYSQDSVFGSFTLNFRVTERLKFKTSVKTIFPAFEFNQAKDYLKYSIGLSWIL